MAKLTRGPRKVRTGILNFFGARLTEYIDLAEREWGTKVIRPNRMEAFEAVTFNHEDRCIIAVSIGQSGSYATVDQDDYGARLYRPDYDIQIYTWCLAGYTDEGETSATGRIDALSQRDDIATIIRSMILDNPHLGNEEGAFELIEDTLVEQYSTGEATPNMSGRYIAGCIHEFTLRVEESLLRDAENYANTIEVDADKLMEDQERR